VIPVLSRAGARAFDLATIEGGRVPGLVLMENAGRGVVDAVEREWPGRPLCEANVVVVAGRGNNGGDGFVVARHLATRGARVLVFLTSSAASLDGDARVHFDALVRLGITTHDPDDDLGPLRSALGAATFVVDAVFGTGLSRPIAGHEAEVLEAVRHARRPVVAVDVPSGLDADTGASLGLVLDADLTVTFGAHKLGLLTPCGARAAGRTVVADLGVPGPASATGAAKVEPSARLLDRTDVARLFDARGVNIHKNGAGHVVVFGGSAGHLGAAVMCAHGAFRAGAGLVTIATWPEAADLLDGRVVEVMTVRLRRDDVRASVDEALARARVVVIGPGFGKGPEARAVVEHVLSAWEGPSVVDADALGMFAGEAHVFASSKGAAVLTPHPGELGVLLGSSAADVERDRFTALAECVERARSVTLLKGVHTLIGAPDELPVVNPSGTSALATAGSGDVLSGTIAALACSLDPFEAAFAGAYLHGLGGEAWSLAHGDRGLLAHEIADAYPRLIAGLVGEARCL
jgi:NAD(P)H-hydrate epimerase